MAALPGHALVYDKEVLHQLLYTNLAEFSLASDLQILIRQLQVKNLYRGRVFLIEFPVSSVKKVYKFVGRIAPNLYVVPCFGADHGLKLTSEIFKRVAGTLWALSS